MSRKRVRHPVKPRARWDAEHAPAFDEGFRFSKRHAEALSRICADPDFLESLRRLAAEYRWVAQVDVVHTLPPADLKATLQDLDQKTEALSAIVRALPVHPLAAEIETGHFAATGEPLPYGWSASLLRELELMRDRVAMAWPRIASAVAHAGRPTASHRYEFAARIGELLTQHGIPTQPKYEWAECVGAFFVGAGDPVAHPERYLQEPKPPVTWSARKR